MNKKNKHCLQVNMVVIVRAVVVELNNSVSQTMISPCFSKEGLLVSCQTGCVVS